MSTEEEKGVEEAKEKEKEVKEEIVVNEVKQEPQVKLGTEMSVGNWVLTMLIMAIPIVNIVMLFIWGFGEPDPRRNYAKASLIWTAIGLGLWFLYMIFIMMFFASISMY